MEILKLEKDMAIRAKEDLAAQVRALKKRLQEAEEEQYKAEEDAAALRAELELLHHKEENKGVFPSSSDSDIARSIELELETTKAELQSALQQVQREQQKLAIEQQHVVELTAEREELKAELQGAQQDFDGHLSATDKTVVKTGSISNQGKGHYDHELRELASMVERLENGRQKLLTEIDDQSVEIERLFAENSNLAACVQEASSLTTRWERQVQQCLEQNSVLRAELDDLRTNHLHMQPSKGGQDDLANLNSSNQMLGDIGNSKMKAELAQAKGQIEALNAQVLQLSADLNRASQQLFNLNWLYKPVLANIESRLLQLKLQG